MLLAVLVYPSLDRSVDQVTRNYLGKKRDLKRKRKRKRMRIQERLSRIMDRDLDVPPSTPMVY